MLLRLMDWRPPTMQQLLSQSGLVKLLLLIQDEAIWVGFRVRLLMHEECCFFFP